MRKTASLDTGLVVARIIYIHNLQEAESAEIEGNKSEKVKP